MYIPRTVLAETLILIFILAVCWLAVLQDNELRSLRVECQQSQQQQEEDVVPIPKGTIKRYSI